MGDESLRGDAGLTVVLDSGGDRGRDGLLKVRRGHHDKRVATTELQDGGFHLITGNRGHGSTRRLASGECGGRYSWVTQNPFDRTRGHQQRLEAALGEASASDHVGEVQGGLWDVRRMLEQAYVACHECGRRKPHRLPQGEIPRHHRQYHPKGLVLGIGL
ncbi:Uncharacterised protein [Mycobacteroides abscessus subsp. abscessus]|nr:Uncharacterised protein [Mycobacteroides abscessus subsp. abscessus]